MAESHTHAEISPEPWDQLELIVDSGNGDHLEAFLVLLPPGDVAYTISRLDDDCRNRLFSIVRPEFAADVLEHLEDEHAADVIEDLPAEKAAAIVDELDSDDQADIIMEMDADDAAAILDRMDPEEAEDVRRLVTYDPETAGGIMRTEYLAFPRGTHIDDVIAELRTKSEEYEEYDVAYVYVVGDESKLVGLVRLRNLVLSPPGATLESVMVDEPVVLIDDDGIDEVEDAFDRSPNIRSAPVTDADGHLVGVVSKSSMQEAIGERAEEEFMRFGGIVAGEELRSMPTMSRTLRRLAYLGPNTVALLMSATVIYLYEDVIDQVTALAVFLPVVVGLSGSCGNQAVAVTIRELSLGLARPSDISRILFKEVGVGLFNGLLIGVFLGVVAWITRGSPMLGVIVGVTFGFTSVFATCLGGIVPLILRAMKLDPAMASGPIVTTLVDICGFFLLLNLAQGVMPMLLNATV